MYIDPVWPTVSLSASLKKARLMGRIGSGPCLVGQIGLGVRVSASFQKNVRLVGRLGSGPRLVADRADVVFTHARLRLFKVGPSYDISFSCVTMQRDIAVAGPAVHDAQVEQCVPGRKRSFRGILGRHPPTAGDICRLRLRDPFIT